MVRLPGFPIKANMSVDLSVYLFVSQARDRAERVSMALTSTVKRPKKNNLQLSKMGNFNRQPTIEPDN